MAPERFQKTVLRQEPDGPALSAIPNSDCDHAALRAVMPLVCAIRYPAAMRPNNSSLHRFVAPSRRQFSALLTTRETAGETPALQKSRILKQQRGFLCHMLTSS
jgi:hypothetical protein